MFFKWLLTALMLGLAATAPVHLNSTATNTTTATTAFVMVHPTIDDTTNSCVQFQVSQGTGCAWMCSYCANTLGTNNYYFTDDVCTYETGGCVGNPLAGKLYTCCAV